MKRRDFLLAAGVAGIAGCTSSGSDGGTTPTSGYTPTPSPTETPTPTASATDTATPTEEHPISFGRNGIVKGDPVWDEPRYLRVDVENDSDGIVGPIDVKVHFLDSDGVKTNTEEVTIGSLNAGELWQAFVKVGEGDELDGAERRVEVLYSMDMADPGPIVIENSELNLEPDRPDIEGAVTYTGDKTEAHPDIHGKFYSGGDVVGVGSPNIWEIPSDIPTAFKIDYTPLHYVQAPIVDHEVVAFL